MERRRERFIIIYVFKIQKNLVPNPGIEWIEDEDRRRGLEAKNRVFNLKDPNYIRNLKENSFTCCGPKILNSLPKEVRSFQPKGLNVVFQFKNHLDKYLATIPDEPNVPSLQSRRAACSNSICHQIAYRKESKLPCFA